MRIKTGGVAMLAPEWAMEIIKEVCLANNRQIPNITWRIKKRGSNTGGVRKTYPANSTIVVSVGKDGFEKQVLLHELTHHITNSGLHDGRFYTILRGLLIKYDCLIEEYKKWEGEYRKAALKFL